MHYRVLGPVEVRVDDEALDLGPRKQRSLFAFLLMHHNRTVATDRILDALWGEDAAGKENALWVYISRLRSILGEASSRDILVTKDHGYSVEIDPDDLDAVRFERMTQRGLEVLPGDPVAAASMLGSALDLWRGAPYEEFAYDEFAQPEISRLTTLRQTCLDARIEADLARGRAGELLAELEQQTLERPYDETPLRHLMLALYRAGRQTEALRAFERFRRALADVGTDPSPELARLEEQMLFHDERVAPAADRAVSEMANPYRGLEAFREEDADLFFGRDRVAADIVARLDGDTIVTVVGPSGSGKSSVVRSGVIPALRKGALATSDEWLVASMIPGSHPFLELEAALLRSHLDTPDTLRDYLDGSDEAILRAALRILPHETATLVVVIDQFEELFTVCDPATTERFLTAIVHAARDDRARVRFLITLRADFYDRPLSHPAFGTAMGAGIVNIVPMAPEDLEAAASGPARRASVRLEPALEAALIGDVLGQPGALPLFEFTLTDLFDRRVGDTLTLDAYRAMGGVEGAISRKAERLYEGLTTSQQDAIRQVFLRLVSITDDQTRSRRRVAAAELLSLDLEVADLRAVLDAFGRERLLAFDRSELSGSPTVEVAHEALLEHWERLAEWIAEARDDIHTNARLASLAAEWEHHARAEAYLLSPGRLESYTEWAAGSTLTVTRREREYLEASQAARDAVLEADEERSAREVATRRRARRTAWGLAAAVAVVVIGGGVLLWSTLFSTPPPVVGWVDAAQSLEGDETISGMVRSGLEAAERSLGVEVVEYPAYADRVETLRRAASDGAAVIVTAPGLYFGHEEEVTALVEEFAGTTFIFLDPAYLDAPNVRQVWWDESAGSYLMGVAAAEQSRTGRIGLIGGSQNSYVEWWLASYEQGARSVDPDIEVLSGWVTEDGGHAWDRPDLGRERALDMFASGVDVIFHVAGLAGEGVVSAAREYSLNEGTTVWAIGADADQSLVSESAEHSHILTSMIKRFDLAVETSLVRWSEGATELDLAMDLDNGGIDYADGHPDLDVDLLDDARSQIIEGSIALETVTAANAHWSESPDAIVRIALEEEGCTIIEEPPIVVSPETGWDALVHFLFENTTEEDVWVAIAASKERPRDDALPTSAEGAARARESFTPMNDWVVPPHSIGELSLRFGSGTGWYSAVGDCEPEGSSTGVIVTTE